MTWLINTGFGQSETFRGSQDEMRAYVTRKFGNRLIWVTRQ